jgi:glycosyltransferase involved in cell wall biosynthesis
LPPGTPERLLGVRHVPPEAGTGAFFRGQDFDAIITLTSPHNAESLRGAAPRALQVAWLHLLPPQPDMLALPGATPFIDCAVLVSNFQRDTLRFAGPSQVIGNGIAPPFENMFASVGELRAAKQNRAVYASVPDRGLEALAAAFLLAQVETRLDVYSGMNLYQRSDAALAPLYAAIDAIPRARRHPAISQRNLAAAMRGAAFLAYPNILPETWCIVAQEAIAAGMKVVATELGALPESTMGFADLLPLPDLNAADLAPRFAAHLERNVSDFLARPDAWAEERFAQACEINRRCNWQARAREWEAFLGPAIEWKRGAA